MRSLSLIVLLSLLARPAVAQEPAAVDARTLAGELGRDPQRDVETLAQLRSLGPRAAVVLPGLLAMPWREDAAWRLAWVNAVGELAPYRAPSLELDVMALQARSNEVDLAVVRRGLVRDAELAVAWRRLETRTAFPRGAGVTTWTEIAGGRFAHRVELAVELLEAAGGRARPALPVLLDVLEQPDPRVLGTEHTVPLRRRAAQAILAIDPASAASAKARAVLAGAAPTSPRTPLVPERTRAQIAELLAELEGPDREPAIANLTALAELAVPAMVAALQREQPPEVRAALLEILRELDSRAALATPALHGLLVETRSSRARERCTARCSSTPARRRPSSRRCCSMGASTCAPGRWCCCGGRGASARDALPALAAALDSPHPQAHRHGWNADGSAWSGAVDQTERLQLLAAEAIARIAPADSELAARARVRLDGPR